MARRALLILGVAAAIVGVAAVANYGDGTKGTQTRGSGAVALAAEPPTNAQAIATAKSAFGSLVAQTPTAASDHVPTMKGSSSVVAQARLSNGAAVISLTDRAELCLSSAGTDTCADARDAATNGVFYSATSCVSGTADAVVSGVVPSGVTSVEAGGQTAKPDGDGVVSIDVPGGVVHDVHLSNGGSVNLWLNGGPCGHAAGGTSAAGR